MRCASTSASLMHLCVRVYALCVRTSCYQSSSLRKAVDSALRLVASADAGRPGKSVHWLTASVAVVKAQGNDSGEDDVDSASSGTLRRDGSDDDSDDDSDDGGGGGARAATASSKRLPPEWTVATTAVFRRIRPRWQTKCHAFRVSE